MDLEKLHNAIENGSLFRQSEFWVNAGHAAMRGKNYEQAIMAFGAAMKLDPNNPDILFDLAVAYAEDGDDQTADNLIEQAEQILQRDATKYPEIPISQSPKDLVSKILAADRAVGQSPTAWNLPYGIACDGMGAEATFIFSLKNQRVFAALADQSMVDCVQIRTSDGKTMFLSKGRSPHLVCYAEAIGLHAFSTPEEIRQLMAQHLSVQTSPLAMHGVVPPQSSFRVSMPQAKGMLADNKALLEDGPLVAEINLEQALGIDSQTLKELLPWAKDSVLIMRASAAGKNDTADYSAFVKREAVVLPSHGVLAITLYSASNPHNSDQVRLTSDYPQGLFLSNNRLPSNWCDIRVAITIDP